ncbi:MAG: flagellar biosynthesis anti-sigma factor FlgM [Bdellovibrionaceae bacterium]|nr:flagellar biosynthesis anti-sigma factor FlgM [Pseudobdellovibrionaceae bacterium]
MKITHNKVGQNLNLRDTGKADKTDKVDGAKAGVKNDVKADALQNLGSADAAKVNLSTRAQDIKRAQDIAKSTPDINEEKVARLQKLIDEGNYKVDAEKIAGKMIDEQASWE